MPRIYLVTAIFTTHAGALTKGKAKAAPAFTLRLLTRVSIEFQQ